MKIVIFQGGLGNQIFQYLFIQYVRKYVSRIVLGVVRDGNNHNGFELDKYFEVNISMPNWIYRSFKMYERYKHRLPSAFQDIYITEPSDNGSFFQFVYDGYWQNKKYLNRGLISFKNFQLSEKNQIIRNEMLNTNSVAIHVRRGDYLMPPHCHLFANICTAEYYKSAISICYKKMENCHFFVFSDDMDWAKHNLSLENAQYIDWNTGNDSIYDMYLMSFAKINIIANSTFSFWGAYLNEQGNIVIYPKRWFNENCGVPVPDIFPDEWIGLNS